MANDNELVSLIKGAADEDKFDIMSPGEIEAIYRHGLRLAQERPFDEDLLEAVNKFEFEVKKRGGKISAVPEPLRQSVDENTDFTIRRKKPQRPLIWRIVFGILWFIPVYFVTNMIIGAMIGAIAGAKMQNYQSGYSAGYEASHNFFLEYGILVLIMQIALTAALSIYGLLPGTGKYKK